MSNKVAVFNSNIYPYSERFRDQDILIPAKGHIMMDRDEANIFLGTMNSPVLDVDGNHTPEGYKMLKVLGEAPQPEEPTKLKCHQCLEEFDSQAQLEGHIVSMHIDKIVDPVVAEELVKKTERKTGIKKA